MNQANIQYFRLFEQLLFGIVYKENQTMKRNWV